MATPDYNRSAVDAISERVAEVTALAEQLDAALCSFHDIGNISDILESSPSQEDWYGSLDKSTSSTSSGVVGTTSHSGASLHHEACTRIGANKTSHSEEDEFVTASDCTCTPPSRSSSFHTASEGEHPFTPVWWPHHTQLEGSEVVEVIETQSLRLSQEGCTLTKERVAQARDRLVADGSGDTPEPTHLLTAATLGHGGPSPPLHPPQPPPPQGEEDPWAIEDHQVRRATAQDKAQYYTGSCFAKHALTGVF